MSKVFDGSTQYFAASNSGLVSYPYYKFAWFNPDASHTGAITTFNNTTFGSRYLSMHLLSSDDLVRARARVGATIQDAAPATAVNFTAWNACVASFASTTSRQAWLNSVTNTATNTNSVGPVATVVYIGGDGNAERFDGLISHVAWFESVTFTDEMVTALLRGVHPWRLQPLTCVAFWPLWPVSTEAQSAVCEPGNFDALELAAVGSPTDGSHGPPVVPMRTRRAAA